MDDQTSQSLSLAAASLPASTSRPTPYRLLRVTLRAALGVSTWGLRLRTRWIGPLWWLRTATVLIAATGTAAEFGTFSPPLAPPVETIEGPPLFPSPADAAVRLPATAPVVDADLYLDLSGAATATRLADAWQWRVLPAGIIYPSYMASVRESRLSGVVFDDLDARSLLDVALGGRVGLLRYGVADNLRPEGWQLDMEGAAFPRLALNHNWDLEAADFRFGLPLTYGTDQWRYKFSYYHLSSHLGDEFAIRNAGSLAERINYSRDALVWGVSWYPDPAWRLYAEADWAFHFDGGNEPWEFLFGIDYAQPGQTGFYGTPFLAVNGHIREAVDFGGNFVFQTGWLWRGASGHTLRTGLHYFNGKSSQFEFFDNFEHQIGFGIWYDQ